MLIPQASLESSYKTNFSTPFARELVDKYFEIQKKNAALKENDSTSMPQIKPAFTNEVIDEGQAE